ncbi:DNA (cytosine-5-)-methyltransferase [Ranunculus cassubicifolius]
MKTSQKRSATDLPTQPPPAKTVKNRASKSARSVKSSPPEFISDPISLDEAKLKWPHRYTPTKKPGRIEEYMLAVNHYLEAKVDGKIYRLYDDVFVQSEPGKSPYIAKIIEIFEGIDKTAQFSARWYYRSVDTVIEEQVSKELLRRLAKELKHRMDDKRVFYSDVIDENPIGCIVSKININRVALDCNSSEVLDSELYCDMAYSPDFSTFSNLPSDSNLPSGVEAGNMKLLDLYSGCGAMSTGICMGAAASGLNLETRWAVDMNEYACQSLKINHPEAEVRNESAEDFLLLLKEWNKLYKEFSSSDSTMTSLDSDSEDDKETDNNGDISSGVFEVDKLIGIRMDDLNGEKEKEVYFKVQWKGFGTEEDSWEPMRNLSQCTKKIREFVVEGCQTHLLPLPGGVDVICGGPPCQGISGFNRFRDAKTPLKDPRNGQAIVFMDIIEHLKPKYVLMENVVDILKFAKGYLGRYAIGRLVSLQYQTRVGLLAAGQYGLPQFRMRAFFWGALHTEKLPQFPLPTHEASGKAVVPNDFENNVVMHDIDHPPSLGKALCLKDALTDLPPVENAETRDERSYQKPAVSDFQKLIRMCKDGVKPKLYDHIPYQLNQDDHLRTCRIPKKKGANYRDLPGVKVDAHNKAFLDRTKKRERLPSGSTLVPDYAISFVKGKSKKPFGRLWWDEIVTTVVTRPEPHNQRLLHPNQDRVLTVRENARLQGFPDHYKLSGPVKERYMQVGNAVAVPVACALGYALGLAAKGVSNDEPVFSLPHDFQKYCYGYNQIP